MTPRLKVNGVTNLNDARFCAAVGVDYIGFEQDPASPRYVMPAQAREIVDWVVGPEPVGLFPPGFPVREIVDTCADAGFRLAQLQDAAPDVCAGVEESGLGVIRSFAVRHDASGEQLLALVEPITPESDPGQARSARFVRLETGDTSLWGGPGESLGWRAVRELGRAYDLFLAGPLSADNVADAIRMQPTAFDVGESVEESPGVLDFERLGKLVEALQAMSEQ